MKFSQRIGKTDIRFNLQVGSMDNDLRNRLWNKFLELKKVTDTYINPYEDSIYSQICRMLWEDFFKLTEDNIPVWLSTIERVDTEQFQKFLRAWFFKAEWFEVYDLIEFLSSVDMLHSEISIDDAFNSVLKREMSAYRIIKGNIVQITSEEEIVEIEQAISETNKWKSVNTHLTTALNFLAIRKNPNYRNSVKESISAVESICKIITENESATLGEALKLIEKKHFLHSALKKSFSSLYGYTSDSSGIRHSLLENDSEVEFEEAKFMLVSCSAFINFLKAKYTT